MIRSLLNWRSLLGLVAIVIVSGTIFYSQYLAKQIAADERQKVSLWVAASKAMIRTPGMDLTLPNLIRNDQQSIPIIETNEQDSIIDFINLDSARAAMDRAWLYRQVKKFRSENRPLEVKLSDSPYIANRYYYGHTTLLDEVRYYPLVQLFIVALFIFFTLYSITIRNRATTNQLWAGMAKETAHQLGTPVSSLEGWVEMLKETNADPRTVQEIRKDVDRLKLVSDRFGKIGSKPVLEERDLIGQIRNMMEYIRKRATGKVQFVLQTPSGVESPGAATAGVALPGVASSANSPSGLSSSGVASSGLPSSGVASSGVASSGHTSSALPSAGVASSGHTSLGLASAGVASSGVASSGHTSSGLPSSGVASFGLASSGPPSPGVTSSDAVSSAPSSSGVASSDAASSGPPSPGVTSSDAVSSGPSSSGVASSDAASSGPSSSDVASSGVTSSEPSSSGVSSSGAASFGPSSSGVASSDAASSEAAAKGFPSGTEQARLTARISGPLFDWVIENLLKNSLDAMEGKGSITIAITDLEREIMIDVTDTGKGIASRNLQKVFKPGFTTKKRGWGLGLSLSKRVIEQYHKGQLFVRHSELGKGTTFRILLKK